MAGGKSVRSHLRTNVMLFDSCLDNKRHVHWTANCMRMSHKSACTGYIYIYIYMERECERERRDREREKGERDR